MARIFTRFYTIILVISCSLNVWAQTVQKAGLTLPASAKDNKEKAENLFTDSYEAYKDHAFGHDDLTPLSEGFSDSRNGWGASIIDGMSTMYIMGLKDYFEDAVDFASNIDFSKSQTNSTVSMFETTIRYLGGLLSAYELSDEEYPVLLQKAKEVADKLAFAWVDGNPIPYNELNFTTNKPVIKSSGIAVAGTLTLEWATLAKHTTNDTYRQLAEKSTKAIMNAPAPLPGLPAQGIDVKGNPIGGYVTWGGGSDSYFEYLIKYPRLSNTDDTSYTDTWKTAVDSSIKTLLKTSTFGNFSYLADYDDKKQIRHVSSHLACFHGGNWILGGKLLNNQTIVDYGLKLTDACWNTYQSTVTGIGPELFAFISADGNYTGGAAPTTEQLAFNKKHGFYIASGGSDYYLRPEVLESNFYAWRVTGDTKYLDRAASAIDSFNQHLRAPAGYAGIWDVNSDDTTQIDDMESFWFAEVLKYLYLTFDDPNHISLDDWVFNTECHPFKAPEAKSSYQTRGYNGRSSEPLKHRSVAASSDSLMPRARDISNIPNAGARLVRHRRQSTSF